MNTSLLAAPVEIGGRYVVERELGHGATATVYLCADRETGTQVAVKVLRVELAESVGAERFLREIRVTSGLRHPAIVPVLDSGAAGSLLYCVLPFCEQGTLRDRLRESRQLAIPEAVRIATTIAGALAYAHGEGLIHRDIKPENILFSEGKAFLGDFGIARLLHATQGDLTTTTGVVRGTPAYMSPEQASGERNYDERSDIYSLACVVYEMVSGMPPFVGPTSQSVLAQRFSSTPRPMSVYRNSVSTELEDVIAKAMAISPADRHASADEFAGELAIAGKARRRHSRFAKAFFGWRAVAMAGGGLVLMAALIRDRVKGPGTVAVRPDTTQLAIIPFEKEGDTSELGSIDALVYSSFSGWRGITVLEPFRVRDALLRVQAGEGPVDYPAVARSLGAGRYVTGSMSAIPGGWLINAWLHQVDVDTALQHESARIDSRDVGRADTVYSRMARGILVRAGVRESEEIAAHSTASLPALQFYARGVESLNEWDLASADTLFGRASEIDPGYGLPSLWQAQVRAWQRQPASRWLALAERAVADSARLPERHRRLAVALQALGRTEFDEACAAYDALRAANPNDFAAWFGLGQCRQLDYRIVPDLRSPTGWRYHASYNEAVRSYQRAFEILSLSHRAVQNGAFQPLRELLFLRPSQMQGAALPTGSENLSFVGRLDMDGDTLLLRPIPMSLIAAGDPAAVPDGLDDALASQQALFRRIAGSWSTALPSSAVAKEAVAIALEMQGNPTALDTIRVARTLARNPGFALRLATAEVLMRLKFLDPGDEAGARAIRGLADSLLAEHPAPSGAAAAQIIPLAVLTGRCEMAANLARQHPFSSHAGVAPDVTGSADALSLRLVMGCTGDAAPELARIRRRLAASSDAPRGTGDQLVTQLVQLTEGRDSVLTDAFMRQTGTYLLRGQSAARRGLRDTVRAIHDRVRRSRAKTGENDVSPEAIYLEARQMLAIGDTASAMAHLEGLSGRLPFLTPGMLARPVAIAGLMRCLALQGELAAAKRTGGKSRDWGEVYRTLRARPA